MVDTSKDRLIARNPFVLQGDDWRRERAIFSTLLTNGRIRTLHSIMKRVCGDLCDFLAKDTTGGGPHDGTDVGRTLLVLMALIFPKSLPAWPPLHGGNPVRLCPRHPSAQLQQGPASTDPTEPGDVQRKHRPDHCRSSIRPLPQPAASLPSEGLSPLLRPLHGRRYRRSPTSPAL